MAGLEEAIPRELGVPVIDGVGAAVRLAEAIVGLGLKTSKRSTYATPEPKRIIGWPLPTWLLANRVKIMGCGGVGWPLSARCVA